MFLMRQHSSRTASVHSAKLQASVLRAFSPNKDHFYSRVMLIAHIFMTVVEVWSCCIIIISILHHIFSCTLQHFSSFSRFSKRPKPSHSPGSDFYVLTVPNPASHYKLYFLIRTPPILLPIIPIRRPNTLLSLILHLRLLIISILLPIIPIILPNMLLRLILHLRLLVPIHIHIHPRQRPRPFISNQKISRIRPKIVRLPPTQTLPIRPPMIQQIQQIPHRV